MSRLILLAVAFCIPTAAIRADDAKSADIEFHAAALSFQCLDKTPTAFAKANPEHKIIEASIRLSAAFNVAENQIDRIEYRLKMPEAFEIYDYLPKTLLNIEHAAPIAVERSEAAKSVNVISLEGGGKVGYVNIGGKISSEGANEIRSNVQISLLPPKQLVMAASTQDAGHTLLFKLKQFDQITLEGDKDFAFLASVPKAWKGECFMLECTAYLKNSGSAITKKTLMIGLYNSGDSVTRKQVEAIAKAYRPVVTTVKSNSSLDKYSGRYNFHYGINAECNLTLNPDGTLKGKLSGYVGFDVTVTGTWSINQNILLLKFNSKKTPVGTILENSAQPEIVIDSRIVTIDEKTRAIRTESGHVLTPE